VDADTATTDLDELALADPEKRVVLLEVLSIGSLLGNCLISNAYRVTDALVTPFRFTELGERVIRDISHAKRRIKPNELKLAVVLQFGCADGFFVDPRTDVAALRSVLTTEIREGKILFPDNVGRELHDLIASEYPEQPRLSDADSLRALRGLGVGVFQDGSTCVGPFGAIEAGEPRDLGARPQALGYRCSDETCLRVHWIHLTTGPNANINKARKAVHEYIERNHSKTADPRLPLLRRAHAETLATYRDHARRAFTSTAPLIDTLIDGVSLDELRTICDLLLRTQLKEPKTRADLSRKLGVMIANPSDFVSSLTRTEIVQIMLLYSDDAIIGGIDEAVYAREILIAEHEVRSRRSQRWPSSSELRAEIGSQGLRMTAPVSSGFVAMRLFHLMHYLYVESGVAAHEDLAWTLDLDQELSVDELLDHSIRQLPPGDVLEKLILQNRNVTKAAAEYLGVTRYEDLSRTELLPRFLWKLGVPPSLLFDDLRRVEQFQKELGRAAEDEDLNYEKMRGHISNLFAAIEDALQRALVFSTWAFTVDHFMEAGGFAYDPGLDASVMTFIEEHASTSDKKIALGLDGKNTLTPLGAGFSRLSKALEQLDQNAYLRPSSQLPRAVTYSTRPFAHHSRIPFLNLSEDSRETVLGALKKVAQIIQSETVALVRNATLHGNNEFPTRDEIKTCIALISDWMLTIRSHGLYPCVFDLDSQSTNAFGVRQLRYISSDTEVNIQTPQWAVANRMPTGSSPLVIIPSAEIPSGGPLRFKVDSSGRPDPYWNEWPVRWKARPSYESIEAQGPDVDQLEAQTS